LVGPARTLTLSDFRLTNRGSGNPLALFGSAAPALPHAESTIATAIQTRTYAAMFSARLTPESPVIPAVCAISKPWQRAFAAALS
jgi:hypothetical protein